MYSGADTRRIGLTKIFKNVAQQAIALGDDTPVEIPHREPVCRGVQIGMHGTRRAEGIDIRDQVAANTIRIDQMSNRGLFVGITHGDGWSGWNGRSRRRLLPAS